MHAEQQKVAEHAEHAEIAEHAERKNSDRRTDAERHNFRHSITMNHLQQGRLHHTKVLKRLPDAHMHTKTHVQLYTHVQFPASFSRLVCFALVNIKTHKLFTLVCFENIKTIKFLVYLLYRIFQFQLMCFL